jgi:ATP-dependent exoDNAse (exonuclease V) alpha subunit
MPPSSDPDSLISSLMPEQHCVASQIVQAVFGETRTGKTFTVKALINALHSLDKKCLICETAGIAAVQYPGGPTLHSLFHLGRDEQAAGGFRSNIGGGSSLARHILAADLIIIDEVSMLTPWVATRVLLTPQSIPGDDQLESRGKQILFVHGVLQLPPVVCNLLIPVLYRLCAPLLYWPPN